MGLRERFLEIGIPYDDIDKELVELINILNFHLDIPTMHCCFGHTLEEGLVVGFSEHVDDKEIMDMLYYLEDKINVNFKKWVRNDSKIFTNWYLEDPGVRFDNMDEFNNYKMDYISELLEHLDNYEIDRDLNYDD